MTEDFGFTESIEFVEPSKDNKSLADELEKLIIPFLNKMKENPDKDIHWPNRVPSIDKQIEKIKAVLEKLS